MERLSGIDASFLYMETPAAHMHTIKVAVLEPAPGARYDLDSVKSALRPRLALLPQFRRRVVEVPLGLHHPVWVEDPEFALDQHVRALTLPSPGGSRELAAAVSEVASAPLDRRRALWEIHVAHGLDDGRVAVIAKVHHALADGTAVAELLSNVLTEEAQASVVVPDIDPWRPEPLPSSRRLLRDALRDHLPNAARLPTLLRRTVRGLRDSARQRRASSSPPPLPLLDVPRTSLNGALSARREFALLTLPLADIKHIKAFAGVTFNDVVLALVAGSLRRYLQARGELPARALVAEVPTSLDGGDPQRRLVGNRVSNLFTSLCTDVADPLARLQRIHTVTQSAKDVNRAMGPEMFRDWTDYAPPRALRGFLRVYSWLRLADHHVPAVNVIVSTVAGPRRPLGWGGGRLAHLYSVGPLIEGAALNVTAWSYVDQLDVGILASPGDPDAPHEIARGLEAALEELCDAVRRSDRDTGHDGCNPVEPRATGT